MNTLPQEIIYELIELAIEAPSASNSQNYRFISVNEPKDINTIADTLDIPSIKIQAQALIIVLSDNLAHKFPDREKPIWEKSWPQNCAAATQNILIATSYFDLNSFFFPNINNWEKPLEELDIWDLPKEFYLHGIISLNNPRIQFKENTDSIHNYIIEKE